ncbi:MAG TPA: chitobiase/beta-hexosaminidase C-terminal domain-containing protein, partial [Bryobacteraceae bacterium]
MAFLLRLHGQPTTITKHIFPSRNNTTAVNTVVGTESTPTGQAAQQGFGITYHGGPIMTGTPNVYIIWYGNWASDPTGVTILTHFLQYDGGSPYYGVNTTYSNASSVHITNAINYVTSYSDNYSLGKSLTDANIQSIVGNAITGGHLPNDSNGVYFVLTYQDVQETSGFISQYCGWHSYGTIAGSTIKYAFVGDANTQGLANCSVQTVSSPNGDPAADAMASVVAHELEESTSDPQLNAWYDSTGNENADKCAWNFGTTYTAINGSVANMNLAGYDYLVQQNWANLGPSGFCALTLPSAPTLLSVSPNSGAVGATVPVTITGTSMTGGTVAISGTGVSASGVTVTATKITANFVITAGAAATARNVTVTTANGTSNPEIFTVTAAQVAAPAFNPVGGVYSTTQNVVISTTTSGASIRYTTDGSTPTSTVGTVYSAAVPVASSLTLKAIAYKSGMTDSPDSSAAYTISSGGGGWANGYGYRRTVTIDHTKVANTDQTNFPVVVTGTYGYLGTT